MRLGFRHMVSAPLNRLPFGTIVLPLGIHGLNKTSNWKAPKMTDLTSKTALITAAGQGIGRAAAIELAKAGARVIATDINEDTLAELSGLYGIDCQKLDVLDALQVADFCASFGPCDILFNCAGVVHSGSVLEMPEADLDFALDLNVRAMVRMVQAILPKMLERGDGTIINMSSVASSVKGVPNRAAYTISKAAVIGLTKSIAADFVAQSIRCNAICPGTVESPSLQARLGADGNYEKNHAEFVARQPIGRIGTPQEIAELVVYLAGATYTTGQAYAIDGGWTI